MEEPSSLPSPRPSDGSLPRLTSPSVIRALLDSLGHRPNKGLGQNYLIDGNILGIIVQAAEIQAHDRLLEIGPGLGALTQALLAAGAPLTVIEKDPTMARHIAQTFPGASLLKEDVLNVDLSELFEGGINKIVANLPYSVGSRFIVDAMEACPLPDKMVFMVQKEVADRLTARAGGKNYGPLAIWSQLNYDVKTIKNVSPNCFMPAPKVWSAVVRFEKRDTPLAEVADYARFKTLVKTAFTQRRKQIGTILRTRPKQEKPRRRRAVHTDNSSNLSGFFPALERTGIDPTTRPEQISIEQWVRLSRPTP